MSVTVSVSMGVSMHVSAAMLGYLYTSHVLNRSTIIVSESSIGSRAYWAVVVVGNYTT